MDKIKENNFDDDFLCDEDINNRSEIIKDNNRNKNNKVKKELDNLIKKMNRLYSDFQNHSK